MADKFPEEDEAAFFAFQLSIGAQLPMVLKSAIELGLLDTIVELASSPGQDYVSASVIADRLPVKNPDGVVMIDRIMRLLASYSIVNCDVKELPDGGVERVYGAAPVCKYLTKNEDGISLAPLCLMNHDKVFMESWYYLKDAVLEGGIPFNKAHGMSAFEYPSKDKRFNQVFNLGMSDTSIITMTKLLEMYKGFEGLGSVVDVGGGTGAILRMITSKYPSIKGLNFDLPHVIADAPSYPNVEHVGGDMFVAVPKGDAILMKWILHDWSDEHCLKVLKNCYKAIPDEGKVILVECILPERPDTSLPSKLIVGADLLMLAYNPGGKERTKKEFESLAKAAGFRGFRVDCNAYCTSVMELLKNDA